MMCSLGHLNICWKTTVDCDNPRFNFYLFLNYYYLIILISSFIWTSISWEEFLHFLTPRDYMYTSNIRERWRFSPIFKLKNSFKTKIFHRHEKQHLMMIMVRNKRLSRSLWISAPLTFKASTSLHDAKTFSLTLADMPSQSELPALGKEFCGPEAALVLSRGSVSLTLLSQIKYNLCADLIQTGSFWQQVRVTCSCCST